MNLKFSGVGAEPKKLAALGVCVALAGWAYFANSAPGDSGPAAGASTSTRPVAQVASTASTQTTAAAKPGRLRGKQRGAQSEYGEFRPSLKPKKDAVPDRASIDPTLRLDLLQKLRDVKFEGATRSLFESGGAPAAMVAAANIPKVPKIIVAAKPPIGPQPPPPPAPKIEPPAPPIPLKFYGFISPRSVTSGAKRAFFLDGDDIIVATEGQTIKNRYKIVRIGVNSAVVEDTQFKNHQQTLPLVEEQQG
jgi:hypothetical protein